MGRDVPAIMVSHQDRRRHREKLRQCVDVFARMLRESQFTEGPQRAGLEVELNLVDATGSPAMRNGEVLAAIEDPRWAHELGQFNLELNLEPYELTGDVFARMERGLTGCLGWADQRARLTGSRVALIGILPSLRQHHAARCAMSPNLRYQLLNDEICAARGEEIRICIDGAERLLIYADNIMAEAACTSVQCHLQVTPETFSAYWNAAGAISGIQVALAANSPFLFGRELWAETRITLFQQATDTRPEELAAQGVRPRVWFGERWITSAFDLFEENLRYFPPLLPLCEDEDPLMELKRGATPRLGEMTLHNGTVYRWNRPVYAVEGSQPHLRVENRVLPAGPTVADIAANAAFYYGLVIMLAEAEQPVWEQMSFLAAHDNLMQAARQGIGARVYWPGLGEVPVTELVLRKLLPLAREGLHRRQVDSGDADRLLEVIEQRCLRHRTGASWQTQTVRALEERGLDRRAALREMTQHYLELMAGGEPVHTWPLP
jgi:gamma-glutamylcysteine synthetase